MPNAIASKAVTVEDASPSPPSSPSKLSANPPLPDEPVPSNSNNISPDQSHNPTAGNETKKSVTQQAEDIEEWDPSAESSLKDVEAAVEKPTAAQIEESQSQQQQEGDKTNGWQAVWAPAQNAYYFWNARTGATTWQNPLLNSSSESSSSTPQPPLPAQPPLPPSNEIPPPVTSSSWGSTYLSGPSSSSSTASYGYHQRQTPQPYPSLPNIAAPITSTIDPDLAHLLPGSKTSLLKPSSSSTTTASTSLDPEYQSAQFNARTGRFTPSNYQYTVDHLAESNRAKRQEGAFFDVDEWEKTQEEGNRKRKAVEEGREEEGGKKISKKDMDRFRQKREEKKARNNAWLRG